jgi:hypothetical protein
METLKKLGHGARGKKQNLKPDQKKGIDRVRQSQEDRFSAREMLKVGGQGQKSTLISLF